MEDWSEKYYPGLAPEEHKANSSMLIVHDPHEIYGPGHAPGWLRCSKS